MRATFRRLLALLDGKPTGARGQSLVELTLTLPVLLVMLMGLTEIGWYANNYLTLLDVVREAGRFGATRDPMMWVDGEEKNYHRMDCELYSNLFNKKAGENYSTWNGPDLSAYGYFIGQESNTIGYYDGVACSVIGNMEPLQFDDAKDDIVVSVFSFAVVNRGTANAYVKIVGRYPARANECQNDDVFDPFDFSGAAGPDGRMVGNGSGMDQDEDHSRWDPGWDNVRGYVFRGNHQHDYGAGVPCLGSEFSTADVEEMLPTSTTIPTALARSRRRPISAWCWSRCSGRTTSYWPCPGSGWGRWARDRSSMCGPSSGCRQPSRMSISSGYGVSVMKTILFNNPISKRLMRSQRGQSIVLLAFAFIALVAFVGLVTDLALLFVRYASLRRAVDAAAIAAAGPDPRGDRLWRGRHRGPAVHRAAQPGAGYDLVETCETDIMHWRGEHGASSRMRVRTRRRCSRGCRITCRIRSCAIGATRTSWSA
ncbi:MAG: pilus assembly protein [Anaerolineae bacterium]|nr:pilus assembly protein [Anaerolineae bacterium]